MLESNERFHVIESLENFYVQVPLQILGREDSNQLAPLLMECKNRKEYVYAVKDKYSSCVVRDYNSFKGLVFVKESDAKNHCEELNIRLTKLVNQIRAKEDRENKTKIVERI